MEPRKATHERRRMSWFGYDPEEVDTIVFELERELNLIRQGQEQNAEMQLAEQTELQRLIDEAQAELDQLDSVEAGLKKWIQRNRD